MEEEEDGRETAMASAAATAAAAAVAVAAVPSDTPALSGFVRMVSGSVAAASAAASGVLRAKCRNRDDSRRENKTVIETKLYFWVAEDLPGILITR